MFSNKASKFDSSSQGLTKLTSIFTNGFKKLSEEWTSFGHPPEQIHQNEEYIEEKISSLFRELISEQEELKKQKALDIERLRDQAKNLIGVLNKPEPEFLGRRGTAMEPLLEFEKRLFQLHSWLISEKDSKMNTFKKVKLETEKLCEELGDSLPYFYHHQEEASLADMIKFNESLKEKKEIRTNKVKELRKSIQENLSALEISTTSDHERNILYFEDKLSHKLISDLIIYDKNLQKIVFEAKKERQTLIRQLKCSSIEFSNLPQGISTPTLEILRAKVAHLKARENSNIVNLIGEAFDSINHLRNVLSTDLNSNKPPALQRSTLEKQSNPYSAFTYSKNVKSEASCSSFESSSDECVIIEENIKNRVGSLRQQRAKRKFEGLSQIIKSEPSDLNLPAKRNPITTFNFDWENDVKCEETKSKMKTSTSTLNNRLEKNEKGFTMGDELKILRIIGASKWHNYINGISIWNEMIQRRDAFPDRNLHSLRNHFLTKVIGNLHLYGVSRAEKNLYDLSNQEKKNGIQENHKMPFNPDYNFYKL